MARVRVFSVFMVVLAFGAGAAQGQLTVGLGNFWPFDEGQGTIAHDVISHQNGTLTNFEFDSTDGWRPGVSLVPSATARNYSIQFDGLNDYINLGNYFLPATASISAWVNIPASSSATPVANPFYILSDEGSAYSTATSGTPGLANYGTVTSIQPNGSVNIDDLSLSGNSDSLSTAPGVVPADGKWHQIVFARGPSLLVSPANPTNPTLSTIQAIYVDGVLRAQGILHWPLNMPAASGAIGMGIPLDTQLLINPPPGTLPPIPAPGYSKGLIDDVRVYTRFLSAANTINVDQSGGGEIASLYASTAPIPGDANMDGTVDGNDLNTVLSNYGLTGANWIDGDFNGDGVVDGADLNAVLSAYGQSGSTSDTSAVPEPSMLLLAAAGIAGLLAYAWRKRP